MIRLVIQRQRGPVVLELISHVEGGQGVGLNRGVAIFVFFAHLFYLVFVFLFIFFPFGLFSFILTHEPLQLREIFCDNAFLVYSRVVIGVLARSTGSVFWYLNSPASILNIYICAKK